MRILILNTWYCPNMMGGAEYSTKLLAEGLVAAGENVAVFCIDNKESGLSEEEINGVRVYRSDGGKYDLYRAYSGNRTALQKVTDKVHEIWNPSIQKDLGYVLNDFKPDLVHCSCFSGLSYKIFSFIEKRGVPVILTLRNYFVLQPFNDDKEPQGKKGEILEKYYQRFTKNKTNSVRYVTAPSDYTLAAHTKKGFFQNAKVVRCIPNCVRLDPEEVRKSVLRKKERTGPITHFLYAGWTTAPKGMKVLMEAFSLLDTGDADLTICGSGNMEGFIKECATKDKRIHFKGRLNAEDLAAEYEAADVLIVPSVWEEPFGRVVIEGNMHGLPVIASDRGGIPEIMKQMHSGIIYPAKDARALADHMLEMTERKNHAPFHAAIIANIGYYSVENQIRLYTDLYKEALSDGQKKES